MSWVLIANRKSARIVDRSGPELSLVESIVNDHEPAGDRQPGREAGTFARIAAVRKALRSAVDSASERSARQFADEIASKLQHARSEGRFARIILVAEPNFMVLLRDALDDVTLRSVLVTMSRDLQAVPLDQLSPHLP